MHATQASALTNDNKIIIYLDISVGEMNEEGVKGFWYASPVFDLVQERKRSLPVVDTTANVFLLVIV